MDPGGGRIGRVDACGERSRGAQAPGEHHVGQRVMAAREIEECMERRDNNGAGDRGSFASTHIGQQLEAIVRGDPRGRAGAQAQLVTHTLDVEPITRGGLARGGEGPPIAGPLDPGALLGPDLLQTAPHDPHDLLPREALRQRV